MYTRYDLEEEESNIRRSGIEKIILSQMRFKIENGELFQLPPKQAPRPRK